MPVWLVDYMLTVSGATRITDIALDDINSYLKGLDEYHDKSQDIYSGVGYDWDRISH